MGLPDVSINILNGQLGRTEGTADGVAGLVLTGTNTPEETALLGYGRNDIARAVNDLVSDIVDWPYGK